MKAYFHCNTYWVKINTICIVMTKKMKLAYLLTFQFCGFVKFINNYFRFNIKMASVQSAIPFRKRKRAGIIESVKKSNLENENIAEIKSQNLSINSRDYDNGN